MSTTSFANALQDTMGRRQRREEMRRKRVAYMFMANFSWLFSSSLTSRPSKLSNALSIRIINDARIAVAVGLGLRVKV